MILLSMENVIRENKFISKLKQQNLDWSKKFSGAVEFFEALKECMRHESAMINMGFRV